MSAVEHEIYPAQENDVPDYIEKAWGGMTTGFLFWEGAEGQTLVESIKIITLGILYYHFPNSGRGMVLFWTRLGIQLTTACVCNNLIKIYAAEWTEI